MSTLAGVAHRHPHTAYEGLKKSLQQEWSFVQRVTSGIGVAFQAVEDELRDSFLMSLFQGDTYQIPGRAITGLPANQAWIALPDPTQTAGANWTTSCVITGYLVAALRKTAEFMSGYHALLMGEGRAEIQQRYAKSEDTALGEARAAASKPYAQRMGRIHRAGV